MLGSHLNRLRMSGQSVAVQNAMINNTRAEKIMLYGLLFGQPLDSCSYDFV